jgi:hypothetical protein
VTGHDADVRYRGQGDVTETGEGERILPAAIVEKFVAGAGGAFEPLTEGSTRPLALTVTNAGICKVPLQLLFWVRSKAQRADVGDSLIAKFIELLKSLQLCSKVTVDRLRLGLAIMTFHFTNSLDLP